MMKLREMINAETIFHDVILDVEIPKCTVKTCRISSLKYTTVLFFLCNLTKYRGGGCWNLSHARTSCQGSRSTLLMHWGLYMYIAASVLKLNYDRVERWS